MFLCSFEISEAKIFRREQSHYYAEKKTTSQKKNKISANKHRLTEDIHEQGISCSHFQSHFVSIREEGNMSGLQFIAALR